MFVSTLRHRILIIMLVSFIRGTCRNISKHLFHGFLFHNTGIVRPQSQGNVGDCEMLSTLPSNASGFQMRKKRGYSLRDSISSSTVMAGMLVISMVPRLPSSTETLNTASLSGASTIFTKS